MKFLTPKDIRIILFLSIGLLLAASLLFSLNYFILNQYGTSGEFLTYWKGARAFLFDHVEPYSAYTPSEVQSLVYGRQARPGEKPYILDMPFHLLILFFPFALLKDPQTARAIYTLVMEVAFIFFILWTWRLAKWKPGIPILVLYLLFGITNIYSFLALSRGSITIFLGFLFTGMIICLMTDQDELAGALAALSMVQWETGGPFLIFMALRIVQQRRWRCLAGFGLLNLILFSVSFYLYPGWIIPFLRAVVNNLRAEFGVSLHQAMSQFWPDSGSIVSRILTLIFLIFLLVEWGRGRGDNQRLVYWTACFSLAVTPFLGIRTELDHLAILIMPLGLALGTIHERWSRNGAFITGAMLITLIVVPWLLFAGSHSASRKMAESILFVLFPALTIFGLYWMRWWSIRPPRTWLDQIGHST